MSKYIDADALIGKMRGRFIDSVEENIAVQIIKSAPSIDIEPKRGWWIDCGSYYKCSLCGEIEMKYEGKSNYCPNCGADMR